MPKYTITETFTYEVDAPDMDTAEELFSEYMETDDDRLTAIGNETEVTLSNLNNPKDVAFELAKAEILKDMANGVVPATVDNFSDLHDFVDANMYGGVCDEGFSDLFSDASMWNMFIDVMQDNLDVWLWERAEGLFEWCNTDSPAKHRAPKGSTKPFDGNGVNLCPKCTQSAIDELNGIDPEDRAGIDADEIALCEYCKTVHLYWTSDYCRARELAGDEHAPQDDDTLLKCPTCHEVHRNTAEVVERHRH